MDLQWMESWGVGYLDGTGGPYRHWRTAGAGGAAALELELGAGIFIHVFLPFMRRCGFIEKRTGPLHTHISFLYTLSQVRVLTFYSLPSISIYLFEILFEI